MRRGLHGARLAGIQDRSLSWPAAAARRSIFNFPPSAHYDLIVVGSGPAAQKCAIDSVKRGKRVALIDKNSQMGGVCVHTGTIPSKTFREAVLHLTGYRHHGFYGRSTFMANRRATINDILSRVQKVEDQEAEVVRHQIRRNGVAVIPGTARFLESKSGEKIHLAILLTDPDSERKGIYKHRDASLPKTSVTADKVLIACGTRPVRNEKIKFDGKRVFDSDQLLWGGIDILPRSLVVVGAGVVGIEYASMVNVLPGTTVTVIDPRKQLLSFADREVVDALMYSMRSYGARFMLGETVERVENLGDKAIVHLSTGKKVAGEGVLYTMGRQGNTDTLNLGEVGLESDKRGLLDVNSFYQTSNPNIYAAGDCIGFPALASTSMEQGRRASCHMWGDFEALGVEHHEKEKRTNGESVQEVKPVMQHGFLGRDTEQLFPYGIYTIPEISMIGKTEEQLTAEKVPYEVGIANYAELAKGQMLGGSDGFLKIIFSPNDFKILGVHAIGEGATEIVHIGQVVMSAGGTIHYFVDVVFNYPTLAEAYNVAAQNGLRNVGICT